MQLNDIIIKQKNYLVFGMIRLKLPISIHFFQEGAGGGGAWGKWPKRVIKIMKIASPHQVDVCNRLKLPAIKVKLSEKLLPAYVWNKGNLELPHLITKHWEIEKIISKEKTCHLPPSEDGGFWRVLSGSRINFFFYRGSERKEKGLNKIA